MKEALSYIGKDKNGNYIFRKALAIDIIMEACGIGSLSRALLGKAKQLKPLIFVSKGFLKYADREEEKR